MTCVNGVRRAFRKRQEFPLTGVGPYRISAVCGLSLRVSKWLDFPPWKRTKPSCPEKGEGQQVALPTFGVVRGFVLVDLPAASAL